jgi:hypothetical protein
MSEFYQIDFNRKSSDAQQWEKLNFIIRQIFDLLKNLHGEEGPVTFYNPIRMTANAIMDGPLQKNLTATDFVTKNYLSSVEAGNIYLDLLKSGGKTPLPISGGGGGISDHALLTHLDYATAAHTGFAPANRTISTTSPLSGGGDLSANRTLSIPKATGSVDGYLFSTDWTTFNSKVGGSGTIGKIPKFATTSTLGDSIITENAGEISFDGTLCIGPNALTANTLMQVSGAHPLVQKLENTDDTSFMQYSTCCGTSTVWYYVLGTTFVTSGRYIAASGVIEASGAGGLALSAMHPSGSLRFWTGGGNLRAIIDATGLEVTGKIKATSGAVLPCVTNLIDAATIATNAALGNHFRVTLVGNRTLGNPTNGVDGQRIIWEFTQDASGNRTLTLDTKFSIPINMPDTTLSTGPGKTDMMGAIYNAVLDKWIVTGFMKEYA